MASRCAFMAPTIMGSSGVPAAGAEAAGLGRADQAEPDLGVWVTGEEPVRGGDLVRIDFESTSLNVDGNELTAIFLGEPRLDHTLIDLVAAPGKLFFAVSRVRRGAHGLILPQAIYRIAAPARPNSFRRFSSVQRMPPPMNREWCSRMSS